jgi:hypothetical protein
VDTDKEFTDLITEFVDVFGEGAFGSAWMRTLENVPHRPLEAPLRHLVPASSRARAVMVDADVVRERLTELVRQLMRPH